MFVITFLVFGSLRSNKRLSIAHNCHSSEDLEILQILVHYQEVVYDNLPKYCTCCKHQGHDKNACRLMKDQSGIEVTTEEVTGVASQDGHDLVKANDQGFEKLQGDARDYLNAKRAGQIILSNSDANISDGAQIFNMSGTSKNDDTVPKDRALAWMCQVQGVQNVKNQHFVYDKENIADMQEKRPTAASSEKIEKPSGSQSKTVHVQGQGFNSQRQYATIPVTTSNAVKNHNGDDISTAVARGTKAVQSTLHSTVMVDANDVNNLGQQEVGTTGHNQALKRDMATDVVGNETTVVKEQFPADTSGKSVIEKSPVTDGDPTGHITRQKSKEVAAVAKATCYKSFTAIDKLV